MAKFIADPPKSDDRQARRLLNLNTGRQVSGRERSNGSVAKGGKRVGDAVGVSGGSQ